MLDTTNSKRLMPTRADNRTVASEPWRDGIGFALFLAKLRQQKPMLLRLMLAGAAVGWLLGVAYTLVRVPAFSASSELLISNTTLQLSGPDAVVTQILVENSLIQSAIEMLKSGRVLGRVVDRIGLENIERILPRPFQKRAGDWIGLGDSSTSQQEHSEAVRKQAAQAMLRSSLSVNRVGASQIISVRGRALTAQDAARLTNEIAGAFVQEQNDTNAVVTTSAALRERIKVLGPAARIISEASPPNSTEGPTAIVALALATILGGMLGVCAGLVLTLVDRRLRSAEQIVAVTSVECFGYVPRMNLQEGTQSQDGGRFHWVMRSVLRRARSAVLERSGRAPRFVGVTSCFSGEGKSTLAANWARFIAHDGSPVLFVDASCCAGIDASDARPIKGLHELLRGDASPADVIQQVGSNLDYLPSGTGTGSLDMMWGNLVHAINAGPDCPYDWVILDLPAIAAAADTRSAGQIVDELLILAEWGRTSEAEIEQTLRALGPVRERVVGTVINKAPWSSLDWKTSAQAQALCRPASADPQRSDNGR
jgi:Mrp family chromosome partitioning ATPase/capsular polysaccharide biosynthesis protein